MVTKSQALTCNEFHSGNCSRSVGPRGGVTEIIVTWRRNGATQTWKRSPERFRVPVKHGLYAYGEVTETSGDVHAAEDCPIGK